MSQEKVDKYKKSKANRKQEVRKQKVTNVFRKATLSLVCLAVVGWLGFSAYQVYDKNLPREIVEVNYDATAEYINSLSGGTN